MSHMVASLPASDAYGNTCDGIGPCPLENQMCMHTRLGSLSGYGSISTSALKLQLCCSLSNLKSSFAAHSKLQ